MAIAYDTITNAGLWDGSQSSVTWSHTCSGSDRALVVYVNPWQNSCSGVTYNGVSMTALGTYITASGWKLYAFYLKNPASGTNNVVATLNTSTYVRTAAVSFTGADQTTQPDTYTTATSQSSPVTATLTAGSDCYLVAGNIGPNITTWTAGTNTTKVGTSDEHITTFISSAARSSGSQSLAWTLSGFSCSYYLVAVKAVAGASSQISYINGVALADISSFNGVTKASIASVMGVANS